jgi:hypothetical protein
LRTGTGTEDDEAVDLGTAELWPHDVTVAPSPIAGNGLFATASIPVGTEVFRLAARPCSADVDSTALDESVRLLLAPGNGNRFANHSCDPNLWWTAAYALSARRDIAAGEELTSDYSTSTADPRFLLRCHCQSYRCRQLVTGDDWRIPQLQRAYAGHWTPVLQQHIDGL